MAKQIPLSQGKFATVDDEDYDWAMQWKWYAKRDGYNWYARRSEGGKTIFLHREIAKVTDGVQVDHEDRDTLNDRRENLRPATHAQNRRNTGPRINNTSGYKGVSWHKADEKWRAQIQVDGKKIHLGFFDDLIEAARAYDSAALEHHGDFAFQNFPEEG